MGPNLEKVRKTRQVINAKPDIEPLEPLLKQKMREAIQAIDEAMSRSHNRVYANMVARRKARGV